MKVLENNIDITFKKKSFCFDNVASGYEPFLIAELIKKFHEQNILVVLEKNKDLELLKLILKKLNLVDNILLFPHWDCSPYSNISPNKSNTNTRFKTFIKALSKKKKKSIILTSYKSLAMLLPNNIELDNKFILFKKGKNYEFQNIVKTISEKGYSNVSLVLEPNEYAIRGGILDIWPLGLDKPYRLDFFDSQLESIKSFDPISQLSKEQYDSISIYENIEPPLTEKSKNLFISKYRELFGPVTNKDLFIHQISNVNKLDGIEHWLPLFYQKEFLSIFDFFNSELVIMNNNLIDKLNYFLNDIKELYSEKIESYKTEKKSSDAPINYNLLYYDQLNFLNRFNCINKILFNKFTDINEKNYNLKTSENIELISRVKSELELKKAFLKIIAKNNTKKVIFVADDVKNKNKILYFLNEININSEYHIRSNKISFDDCFDDLNIIDVIIFPAEEGFENEFYKVISFYEIFNIKKIRKPKEFKNNILNISNLNIEDYVVHHDHGVGRYVGLKAIKIASMPHDCLIIEYLNNSKLYLPVENINLISKYGDSNKFVTLDKLGATSWNKRKQTIKKKIRDLASSLIMQAAKRNMIKSFKMNINYDGLANFEKGFRFDETEDQIITLNEVYNDLASEKPMDRLICGDVGFGKTEIALRATFISSSNKFKTIIIVPTTLLATQHYKIFKQRFLGHTEVELISRNTRLANKKKILKNFFSNKCNILIGTHALLSINFDHVNLGLIIVDEEQHFGVLQKEKIKKLKNSINLLTLSATPIPRTLHMSLIGIRDLSLIKTPPVNRKDISTTVCRFEKNIIRKAILFEKSRNGQIFMIVPRIKDIKEIIEKINLIHPNINYTIAHGKLNASEIEISMNKFYNGDADLLVSTSIVESGLDIPKANTLIVYKADSFGLAQLHQLRGRIGRSTIKGQAYFTIEKNKISENAFRRLKALQAMDTLGAGINLANYDLDIRGAGNILGEEQSGQILQVGVELYQKLLKECVNDLKNNKEDNNIEVAINIKLPILIPDYYVSDLSLRLSIYRKLGEIDKSNDFKIFEEEMINRFGPIPKEFNNLIELVNLKKEATRAKIVRIDINDDSVLIFFNKNFKEYTKQFINWVTKEDKKVKLLDTYKIRINNISTFKEENQLLQVFKIINKIKLLLNK